VSRVEWAGATYQPSDDGHLALIVPVRAAAHGPEVDNPDEFLRFGDIIDLICWRFESPMRWALRGGSATWLGAIGPQQLDPDPVPIGRTPLRWLQSGGKGICLLSSNRLDRQQLLLQVRHLVAEDIAHGRELRGELQRPLWEPSISIRAV